MTSLDVEYEGYLVGRAVAESRDDRFAFTYDSTWLTRENASPISANLPMRQARWPADRAHAFFANLLPEGAAREAICDRLGVSVGNDVALLRALGGNADGHAKNLSMLYGIDGLRLAPAYDLVCTRAYPRLDRQLAFSIGGERNPDRLQPDNWERFAQDIAVKPRLVIRQLEKMLADAEATLERAEAQLREEVGESHAIQHVSPAIHKRIRAIGAGL